MKKNKKIIKTLLVLPLVWGLFFSLVLNPVFASPTGTIMATVSINPLSLKIFAPSIVRQRRFFRVRARIGNLGQKEIEEVEVTISVPPGLEIKGEEEKEIEEIEGGKEKRVSWRIKANKPGFYVIQVDARGIMAETEDLVTSSETATVEVRVWISFWDKIRQFFS